MRTSVRLFRSRRILVRTAGEGPGVVLELLPFRRCMLGSAPVPCWDHPVPAEAGPSAWCSRSRCVFSTKRRRSVSLSSRITLLIRSGHRPGGGTPSGFWMAAAPCLAVDAVRRVLSIISPLLSCSPPSAVPARRRAALTTGNAAGPPPGGLRPRVVDFVGRPWLARYTNGRARRSTVRCVMRPASSGEGHRGSAPIPW